MRILYPFNPSNNSEADEPYQEEFLFVKSKGGECSLFDFDALEFDEFKPKPTFSQEEKVLYRGWMLSPDKYKKLINHIRRRGGVPVTDHERYVNCHHISEWYDACKEFTPETKLFQNDENLVVLAKQLNWPKYFVKDFVKSNSTERGSIADSAEEVVEIIKLIEKYRGSIEGGIALRAVENYLKNTEVRYFICNGKVYSSGIKPPNWVEEIAKRIKSPFFSVDVIQRADGMFRLVELGDGQVSDKKSWTVDAFATMLLENS